MLKNPFRELSYDERFTTLLKDAENARLSAEIAFLNAGHRKNLAIAKLEYLRKRVKNGDSTGPNLEGH